jgi:hypothetical protein
MNLRATVLLAALLALTGCSANGRVRQISPGLYSTTTRGDGYVSAPKLREDSLDRAEEFCAHQGKRMRLAREDSQESRADNGATIRVTFRCVEG